MSSKKLVAKLSDKQSYNKKRYNTPNIYQQIASRTGEYTESEYVQPEDKSNEDRFSSIPETRENYRNVGKMRIPDTFLTIEVEVGTQSDESDYKNAYDDDPVCGTWNAVLDYYRIRYFVFI